MKILCSGLFAILSLRSVYGSSLVIDTVQRQEYNRQVSLRARNSGAGVAPEFSRHSFWYARGFNIGASKNLELFIDTGSSDLLIASNEYNKSKSGENLHKTFNITYYSANKNGGGTLTTSGHLYKDSVEFAGVSYPKQEFERFGTFPYGDIGPIIGFSGKASSSFNGTPWFDNLCKAKTIDECRFGLAFGTNRTGKQIIGKVERTLFKSNLSVARRDPRPKGHWGVHGDVTIAGKIIERNALLVTDSGTSVIEAPIQSARLIFKHLGFQTVFHPGNSSNPLLMPSYLYGYFPCDKPPVLGFSIPSQHELSTAGKDPDTSRESTNFNLEPSVWAAKDNGNNNCTAVILGTDQFSRGFGFGNHGWLVGQAFHQGHYIDHNKGGNTMGFAVLTNPENP